MSILRINESCFPCATLSDYCLLFASLAYSLIPNHENFEICLELNRMMSQDMLHYEKRTFETSLTQIVRPCGYFRFCFNHLHVMITKI
jgi:hypothetical protein